MLFSLLKKFKNTTLFIINIAKVIKAEKCILKDELPDQYMRNNGNSAIDTEKNLNLRIGCSVKKSLLQGSPLGLPIKELSVLKSSDSGDYMETLYRYHRSKNIFVSKHVFRRQRRWCRRERFYRNRALVPGSNNCFCFVALTQSVLTFF